VSSITISNWDLFTNINHLEVYNTIKKHFLPRFVEECCEDN
jgi:hypothetical protein